MRLITHTKLVQRNLAIGKYAFTGGMITLLLALGVNIYAISRPEETQLVIYAFGAFIIGITATNLGTTFNNRWGRRSDKTLAEALKGVDDKYTLYNHRLGAGHVLVGPGGVFVLVPKYQMGLIAYKDGKWIHPSAPRGFLGAFGARDSLGNPSAEAEAEVTAFTNFFKKHLPDLQINPQAVIVFMSPRAEVSAKDSPVPVLHTKQFKDYIRRQSKGTTIPPATLTALEQKLGLAE